jgi:hypothetical protein
MITLSNSVAQKILDAVPPAPIDGVVFALPVVATQFTWQTSFVGTPSAVSIQILTSLDNITFSVVDSSTNTAGESKTVNSSAAFIKAKIVSITGGTAVTVTVIAEESHNVVVTPPSTPLPSAPLGQILTSQGAGVDPLFSPIITLIDPAGSAGLKRWQIKVVGTDLQIDSQNDAGVSYGRPVTISLFNGGIQIAGPFVTQVSMSCLNIGINEVAFASLPAGAGVGTLANISDCTVNTLGATAAGGGTNHVLVRYNGTIWKVAAV